MIIETFKKHLIRCKNVKEAADFKETLIKKCREYDGFGEVISNDGTTTSFRENGKDIIKIEHPNYTTFVHIYIYDDGNFEGNLGYLEEDLLDLVVWDCEKREED